MSDYREINHTGINNTFIRTIKDGKSITVLSNGGYVNIYDVMNHFKNTQFRKIKEIFNYTDIADALNNHPALTFIY